MALPSPSPAGFTWSPVAGRFRDPTGRFVPEARVREALDSVIDGAAGRVRATTARHGAGALTTDAWRQSVAAELKSAHLVAAASAGGGWEQLDASDLGAVGRALRDEYGHLRTFAAELPALSEARALARVAQYARAARGTYAAVRLDRDRDRGMREERNRLSAAESCAGCVEQTRRGWVPIGSLVPVGRRSCRSQCRCSVDRRAGARP